MARRGTGSKNEDKEELPREHRPTNKWRLRAQSRPSTQIAVPAGALTAGGCKANPPVSSCPPAYTWRLPAATTSPFVNRCRQYHARQETKCTPKKSERTSCALNQSTKSRIISRRSLSLIHPERINYRHIALKEYISAICERKQS